MGVVMQVVLGALAVLWVLGWLIGQCSPKPTVYDGVKREMIRECERNPGGPLCDDLLKDR